MRSIHSKIALLVAASVLATVAQADGSKPSWVDYRSTVSSVDYRDSFNRRSETNTTTDNSRQVAIDDSFNRSTDIKTSIDDSFNRSTDVRKTNVKKTDNSIHDSYNTTNTTDIDLKFDTQTVSPTIDTSKYVSTLDTQDADNNASMVGPKQNASQGGFYMGSVGEESSSPGYAAYGFGTRVSVEENRTLSQANTAVVDGANLGAVSNVNIANQGRDLVFGPNRSIVDSDLGNKQIMSAGDQAQVQSNDQDKESATSSTAYDQITTSGSK